MTIVYVLQILMWPGYGSYVNLSIPNNHYYETYEECQADAELLKAEAEKLKEVDRVTYYYKCRPAPMHR